MKSKKLYNYDYENVDSLLRAAGKELAKRGISTTRHLELESKPPPKRTAPAKAEPKPTMSQRREHVEELTKEKSRPKPKFIKRIELSEKLRAAGKVDEAGRQEAKGNVAARNAYVDYLGRRLLKKIRTPQGRFSDSE